MAEFKQVFEGTVQLNSTMWIYCRKDLYGRIDHVGGDRNSASREITFNTSKIDANATIESVNFSFTRTGGGNTSGTSIIYIAEEDTDTIVADNDTILRWLNKHKENNSYPDLTLNFWVKATGLPHHTHNAIAESSIPINGNTKVTYSNITLTVSYHLNIDENSKSPNVYDFYIKDNFRELNSILNGTTSFEGKSDSFNSFASNIEENCLFQNFSKLTFSSTAESNQPYDKTTIYNLILTQETNGGAPVIIYNQTQDNGYFSISQDIFSNLTFSYPLADAAGETLIGGYGEKISFSYYVEDAANKITEIHGLLYFLESQPYTRPKINNFSISKDVLSNDNTKYLAWGTYDIGYSNIPIVLKAYGGPTIRVFKYNTIKCIQKVYNINGEVGTAIENDSSQANNELFSNSSLILGNDYTFTLTFSDSFFSGSSSITIKAEDVFLNIETTGVSIGRQISIGEENNPSFEVYFPSIFNGKATFNGGIDFGESVSFDFSKPITFGDDVTFEGDLIFSGSSNLDFSQSIMATGGITVGATGVSNPSGATFNGAATFNSSASFYGSSIFTENIDALGGLTVGSSTNAEDATFYGETIFKKGVTFEDTVTFSDADALTFSSPITFNNSATFNNSVIFNSSLQFNSASFSSASINSGGSLTIASNASLNAYGSSIFTQNINALGGITVGSSAIFNNQTTFNEAAIFKKGVTFEDAVTFSGTDTLIFSRPVTFSNSTKFSAAAQFNSGAIFSSASISSGGTLSIASTASLTAYGNSSFSKNIDAIGGITVGSSTDASPSGATFNGTATFEKETTLNGTTSLNGKTFFNNTLRAESLASFYGTLRAYGGFTTSGNTNISGNLTLKEGDLYGKNFPTSTNPGRIFFKIID